MYPACSMFCGRRVRCCFPTETRLLANLWQAPRALGSTTDPSADHANQAAERSYTNRPDLVKRCVPHPRKPTRPSRGLSRGSDPRAQRTTFGVRKQWCPVAKDRAGRAGPRTGPVGKDRLGCLLSEDLGRPGPPQGPSLEPGGRANTASHQQRYHGLGRQSSPCWCVPLSLPHRTERRLRKSTGRPGTRDGVRSMFTPQMYESLFP